ncbi:DUF935 domain-containing protein [Albimonas sp. CAU 1670]|uniref:DUF935 domain-containing protein n=1 Tax=Albimonas sp. CAU 1670 TaxID=3032599 RepID=UPI0023DAA9E8|nr:DUF935 domain-containing protein [Albimonas sp. CAU 1670]MDF2232184.1 DUF935 domain-containing protein [Albimonas sp. CAU 1670]
MARPPVLLDAYGSPVQRPVLTQEVAAATIGGVRQPISGYPADGLNPVRLASILREADQGDPVRYLELAETIEERDPHYLGVLGTRRRSVSQIDITVEPGSDDARDIEIADMVRDWLDRDELADELFDILDALGKGYSFTEIIWDTSEGHWRPARLERRDPRWFRFERRDLATPVMLEEGGREVPLPPFKFIFATMKAKSGLVLRSGLARVAAWGWMFKAYTQRDWAIFTQTYGQPLRIGKFGAGATEGDKDTLFRAVANIAGDCAAIVPESMTIDFIESKNVGPGSELYLQRSDWLDRQISKAVLGQTTTTDAVSGGHAVSKEHRLVQEDIERADARVLQGILNRDLIRPWVDLEYGPQARYPRLRIARPEAEDLKQLAESLNILVPLGVRVSMSEVRDRFGLADPGPDDEILVPRAAPAPPAAPAPGAPGQDGPMKAVSAEIKGGAADPGTEAPQMEDGAPGAVFGGVSPEALLADRLAVEAQPAMGEMMARIEAMVEAAQDMDELREMFLAAFPKLDASGLANALALGLLAAQGAGRAEVVGEDG